GQVFTWVNTAGGTFSVPGNWNPAGPPTLPGHSAIFNQPGNYGVTLSGPAAHGTLTISAGSVGLLSAAAQSYSVSTLLVTGASLSINSGVQLATSGLTTIDPVARININGTGALNPASNVLINGGSLFRNNAGGFNLASGRTLTVQGAGTANFTGNLHVGSQTISVTQGLLNLTGALEVGTGSPGGNGTVTINGTGATAVSGALSQNNIGGMGLTGEVSFFGGSTGTLGSVALGVDNTPGTLGRLQVTSSSLSIQNLAVAAAGQNGRGEIILSGTGPTLTQSGASTLVVGAAGATSAHGTITINGGTFITGTGTSIIHAGGRIQVAGGAFRPMGDVIVNAGQINITSGSLSLAPNRTLWIENGGSIVSSSPGGLAAINNGQTVRIHSGTLLTSALREVGASTDGTIALTGPAARLIASGGLNVGTLDGDGTVLVNSGIASFTGGIQVGAAATPGSDGLLAIHGGQVSISSGRLQVGGKVGQARGVVTVDDGTLHASSGATVDQLGTLLVGTHGTLQVSGGSLAVLGRLSVSNPASGAVMLPTGQLTSIGAGGSLGVAGPVVVPSGSSMIVEGGVLEGAGPSAALSVGSAGTGTLTVSGSSARVVFPASAGTSAWGSSGAASITFTDHSAGTFGTIRLGGTSNAGLEISHGARLAADKLLFGTSGSGATTINLAGPLSSLAIEGTLALAPGGTISVSNGAVLSAGGTSLPPGSCLQINASTVNLGAIGGAGGTIHLQSGLLTWEGSFSTGASGLLGFSPVVSTNRWIRATGGLVLPPFSALSLTGGFVSVGSIDNQGGTLLWSGGTLEVTGGLALANGGPIGPSLALVEGKALLVPSASLSVAAGATLALRGGVLEASELSVASGGQMLLEDAASVLRATVVNHGRVLGSAVVSGQFFNGPGGEVSASGGERIRLTQQVTNLGQMHLSGGEIETGTTLLNQPSGRISGRGLLRSRGLNNSGSLLLSAGASDIFGPLANQSGGKTIVTGSAVASFYDDLTNAPGSELRISTGSTAVFFGLVTGTSLITGTGTAVFEGGTALDAIVNGGRSVVGRSGQVNATVVRQVGVTIEGQLRLSVNPAVSVSRVTEFSIAGSPGMWEGALDLANNALVIDYSGTSPLPAVDSQVRSGFNGGAWDGLGIRSSEAAGVGNRAIGLAEAADIGSPLTFLGEPVDSTSLLLRYTLPGDSNLDGRVEIGDFALLGANFNQASYWAKGDFNYDGLTNLFDFALLGSNFNRSLGFADVSPGLWLGMVPEPGLGVIGLILGVRGLWPRRRAISA
ncbi:MAG: hypothetical protein NZ561_08155, partial [Phycisphaerae bacterium]|nr:hypothetical protein [Phycisphaerae bacterium]